MSEGNGRVVVIGSLNLDRRLELERLPRPGETVTALQASTGPGGKGLNQAVAAARAGGRVELLGCVGDDSAGRELLALGRAEGIGLDGMAVLDGVATGQAMVWVDETGENSIVVVAGANAGMRERSEEVTDHLGRLGLHPSDVVLAQGETSLSVTAVAFAAARAAGARTILNLAPFRDPGPELLAVTTLLVVNELEFAGVAGVAGVAHAAGESAGRSPGGSSGPDDRVATARAVLQLGPEVVVVTLGAGGVVAVAADRVDVVDGRVVEVVDTTGAGDGFVGALAAGLVGGRGLEQALIYANAAASLVVQRPGAASSMPFGPEIEGAAVRPISGP